MVPTVGLFFLTQPNGSNSSPSPPPVLFGETGPTVMLGLGGGWRQKESRRFVSLVFEAVRLGVEGGIQWYSFNNKNNMFGLLFEAVMLLWEWHFFHKNTSRGMGG